MCLCLLDSLINNYITFNNLIIINSFNTDIITADYKQKKLANTHAVLYDCRRITTTFLPRQKFK